MYLWKWTWKSWSWRRLDDVIHKVRESKNIKWKEKLVLRGTYISPWQLPRERGKQTYTESREGESVMRIRLSNSARQNGPLKMEINIRRRLISIANRKRRLFYRLPHSRFFTFKDWNKLSFYRSHTHTLTHRQTSHHRRCSPLSLCFFSFLFRKSFFSILGIQL